MATASDGPQGGDSPFTAALLDHIDTPGLDVKEVFFRVGEDVNDKTKGAQRPQISVSSYDACPRSGRPGIVEPRCWRDCAIEIGDECPQSWVSAAARLTFRPRRTGQVDVPLCATAHQETRIIRAPSMRCPMDSRQTSVR